MTDQLGFLVGEMQAVEMAALLVEADKRNT